MKRSIILQSFVTKTAGELQETLQTSGYFGFAVIVLTDGKSLSAEYIVDPAIGDIGQEIQHAIDGVLSKYAEPIDMLGSE